MRLLSIFLIVLLLVLPATMGHTTGNSGRIILNCSAPVVDVQVSPAPDTELMPGLILF